MLNKVFGKAFPLVLGLCLLVGALGLTGCQNETDPQFIDRQFIPAGKWIGPPGPYQDYYEIVKDDVLYHTPSSTYQPPEGEEIVFPETNLKGDIIVAVDFSETSGVLIIKVTSEDPGQNFAKDKFTGIYYSEYTASSIKLANPWIGFDPVQKDTLNDALETFTVDNVGDHVGAWGAYTK